MTSVIVPDVLPSSSSLIVTRWAPNTSNWPMTPLLPMVLADGGELIVAMLPAGPVMVMPGSRTVVSCWHMPVISMTSPEARVVPPKSAFKVVLSVACKGVPSKAPSASGATPVVPPKPPGSAGKSALVPPLRLSFVLPLPGQVTFQVLPAKAAWLAPVTASASTAPPSRPIFMTSAPEGKEPALQ